MGCRGETIGGTTPTPFPSVTAVSVAAVGSTIQPISLTELMADPDAFRNQQIEVTGQFQRLPRLFCAATPYRSPASFTLREGDVILLAAGLGSGRDVAPDGLTMTVNGRLLAWEGPVGCGKQAIVQPIWYIEVNRVIAPRPITNATLTPVVIIAQTDNTSQSAPTATPTFTPTPDEIDPDLQPPAEPTPTPTPANLTPTPTPTPDPDENGDNGDDENGDNGDDDNGTNGNRENGNGPTPTPTAEIIDPITIEQGQLLSGELVGSRLAIGEIHEWQFEIEASDVLTVSAIASQGDLIITLLADDDTILQQQNAAPEQEVETIVGFELAEPGTYRVLVEVEGYNTTADYHLLFMLSDSYAFVTQGLLLADTEQTNIILAAETDHNWHIVGEAGTTISILITPLDNMDPFIRLYGPSGEAVEDENGRPIFIDNTGAGESEELTFTLPETGMYAIQVGDYDFLSGEYTIIVRVE